MSNADDPIPEATPESATPKVPLPLRVALAVVGVEAVAFLVLAVVEVFSTGGGRVVMALSTAVFFVGWGVTLLACARGMWRAQSWGRSLVVLGQLLQLGVAWSYRDATPDLAAALAVSGIIVLVGLFLPPSLRWFEQED